MALSILPSVATGDLLTAANWNVQVVDNINGLNVGTTAGDMAYWNASNTRTRLPVGSDGDLLVVNSGVPAYKAAEKIAGAVKLYRHSSVHTTSSSSTTERSLPFSTFSFTTTEAADIAVFGSIIVYVNTTPQSAKYMVRLDSTNYIINNAASGTDYESSPLHGHFENVAAGSHTIVIREKLEYGNQVDTLGLSYTVLIAVR